jgi:cyclic pyranopterin phosphate synthase
MEALTAVSAGLLTVYDMVKGIPDAQPGLTIEGVQLVYKRGGKSDVGAAAATR